MPTYRVTYEAVVEARTENEAQDEADRQWNDTARFGSNNLRLTIEEIDDDGNEVT
jgi:hypothetical protein